MLEQKNIQEKNVQNNTPVQNNTQQEVLNDYKTNESKVMQESKLSSTINNNYNSKASRKINAQAMHLPEYNNNIPAMENATGKEYNNNILAMEYGTTPQAVQSAYNLNSNASSALDLLNNFYNSGAGMMSSTELFMKMLGYSNEDAERYTKILNNNNSGGYNINTNNANIVNAGIGTGVAERNVEAIAERNVEAYAGGTNNNNNSSSGYSSLLNIPDNTVSYGGESNSGETQVTITPEMEERIQRRMQSSSMSYEVALQMEIEQEKLNKQYEQQAQLMKDMQEANNTANMELEKFKEEAILEQMKLASELGLSWDLDSDKWGTSSGGWSGGGYYRRGGYRRYRRRRRRGWYSNWWYGGHGGHGNYNDNEFMEGFNEDETSIYGYYHDLMPLDREGFDGEELTGLINSGYSSSDFWSKLRTIYKGNDFTAEEAEAEFIRNWGHQVTKERNMTDGVEIYSGRGRDLEAERDWNDVKSFAKKTGEGIGEGIESFALTTTPFAGLVNGLDKLTKGKVNDALFNNTIAEQLKKDLAGHAKGWTDMVNNYTKNSTGKGKSAQERVGGAGTKSIVASGAKKGVGKVSTSAVKGSTSAISKTVNNVVQSAIKQTGGSTKKTTAKKSTTKKTTTKKSTAKKTTTKKSTAKNNSKSLVSTIKKAVNTAKKNAKKSTKKSTKKK